MKVNDYLLKFCFENQFYFNDNSKINRDNLFRDGSHLLESGKGILANNFIYYLDFIYSLIFDGNLWNLECRGTEEGGPNESLTKEIMGGITVILMTNVLKNDFDLVDAETLRLQYSSNLLIAYLNINFLQNKIDTLRVITKSFPLDILFID